jgi:hypothetical protein
MRSPKPHSKITKVFIIGFLTFIILLVFVPIIINEAYKADTGYVTVWNAEDVLSYYATILGAVATIAAVVGTILYNEHSRRVDRQRQIMPLLDCRLETDVVHNLKAGYTDGLDIIVLSFMNSHSTKQVTHKMMEDIKKGKYRYFEYHLHNVGAGNAIQIKVTIDGIRLREFNIQANSKEVLKILIDNNYLDEPTVIHFQFRYTNVDQSAYYKQEESVAIQDQIILNVTGRATGQKEIGREEYMARN